MGAGSHVPLGCYAVPDPMLKGTVDRWLLLSVPHHMRSEVDMVQKPLPVCAVGCGPWTSCTNVHVGA